MRASRVMPKAFVVLPPYAPSFELPAKKRLRALQPGDWVKLIFEQSHHSVRERMWVVLTAKFDDATWMGSLDNDPALVNLKRGNRVTFHPLAVIDALTQADKRRFEKEQQSKEATRDRKQS